MNEIAWLFQQPRRFYVLTLPLLWGAIDFANFFYPGDEYGGWAASSLPGLWAAFFVSGSALQMLPAILIAGLVVGAVFGWLMDRLAVPWGPWYLLWVVVGGMLFYWSVQDYPTWGRAMSKNGSIQAYILPSLNVGLMLSSIVCLFVTAAARGVSRVVRRASAGGSLTF
jgi:hypothetical protein